MRDTEKLYETLGELLFAVAKADGIIQDAEKDSLTDLLANHSWAKQIQWSFDYEANKNTSVEEVYKKVINFCHSYGPTPEYDEFISAMKVIADAAEGTVDSESKIINSFSNDLIARFQKDLDRKG
jgi:uncharacterized tellurite resistance protein B-like protein